MPVRDPRESRSACLAWGPRRALRLAQNAVSDFTVLRGGPPERVMSRLYKRITFVRRRFRVGLVRNFQPLAGAEPTTWACRLHVPIAFRCLKPASPLAQDRHLGHNQTLMRNYCIHSFIADRLTRRAHAFRRSYGNTLRAAHACACTFYPTASVVPMCNSE